MVEMESTPETQAWDAHLTQGENQSTCTWGLQSGGAWRGPAFALFLSSLCVPQYPFVTFVRNISSGCLLAFNFISAVSSFPA